MQRWAIKFFIFCSIIVGILYMLLLLSDFKKENTTLDMDEDVYSFYIEDYTYTLPKSLTLFEKIHEISYYKWLKSVGYNDNWNYYVWMTHYSMV